MTSRFLSAAFALALSTAAVPALATDTPAARADRDAVRPGAQCAECCRTMAGMHGDTAAAGAPRPEERGTRSPEQRVEAEDPFERNMSWGG